MYHQRCIERGRGGEVDATRPHSCGELASARLLRESRSLCCPIDGRVGCRGERVVVVCGNVAHHCSPDRLSIQHNSMPSPRIRQCGSRIITVIVPRCVDVVACNTVAIFVRARVM